MPAVTISEIFASIQGESTFAGLPCVFIRTSGCNLRCSYCDSTYAYEGGEAMEMDCILETVASFGIKLVEVTGGEPLHQENVPLLIGALLDKGYKVLLETNGSYDISAVDTRAVKILDIKCPGSGMSGKTNWDCLKHLRQGDQIKFVISDREDYLWAKRTLAERDMATAEVLFAPVHGVMEPAALAGWILEDKLPVRLQIQIHKHIWDADARGV